MTWTPTGARRDDDASPAPPPRPTRRTTRARDAPGPAPRYDYEHHSRLAGPLTQPDPAAGPYRVRYRPLLAAEPHRVRAALLLGAAPLVSLGLFGWLVQPRHWSAGGPRAADGRLLALDLVMLASIGLIELFRTLNVLSIAHATLVARDPVPVVPEPGTRVAFLTSFVPGKEPLALVTRTLEAAVRVRHRGVVHVWLLDEGDDPDVRRVCARLGVRHFSRRGVPRWNRPAGPYRARTKHGNYNAWLEAHGAGYDLLACVDTDHVPLPNYLERMRAARRDRRRARRRAARTAARPAPPPPHAVLRTPDAARVRTARLMRPSAVTHVTDVDQRRRPDGRADRSRRPAGDRAGQSRPRPVRVLHAVRRRRARHTVGGGVGGGAVNGPEGRAGRRVW